MYAFSRYRLDPGNQSLERDGELLSLTPKAFEVLLVLVENGSRLTTKEELMRRVWPDSFVEESNVTVHISALRRLLGEDRDGRAFIATVPRRGYRFAVPVARVSEAVPGENGANGTAPVAAPVLETMSVSETPPADRAATTPSLADPAEHARPARRWLFPVLALVALLCLCALGYRFLHHPAVPASNPAHARRLAVLPFQNLQADAGSDFLGFSLADAVISRLGYIGELTIRPSYAVQRYTARPLDLAAVASRLDVDTLLTGTFLKEGDDLRIACQLVDVRTQNLLWKGAFDVRYERLLTVQDRVAQQVVRGLELTLTPTEERELRGGATASPAAYEFYLRGVDLYARGEFPTAVHMLERATELAPGFAPAWANLGRAYTANASFQMGGAAQYSKAEAAFNRAIRLAPGSTEARVFLANMLTDTGRVERAVPLLREALRANPRHAEVHWELSYAYRFAGMLQESIAEAERARDLDPAVKLNSSTANGYLYLGRYEDFLRSLPLTDEVALTAFYRGLVALYRKDAAAAQSGFAHAVELDRSLLQAEIGEAFLLGLQHRNAEALEVLRSLERRIAERGTLDPEALYKIAQAYAFLGDGPSALRVLRLSIENGFFPYPYLAADPLLDPVRGEAEFAALLNAARARHEKFREAFF